MRKCTLLLLILFLAGCTLGQPRSAQPSEIPQTPTPTAFQAVASTPAPGPVALWVSPRVPADLKDYLRGLDRVSGRAVEQVDSREQAELLFVAEPDQVAARRVYAVVAPFPTVPDSISLDELENAWQTGRTADGIPLLASPATISALGARLGLENHLEPVAETALMELTWSRRPSLAIVPFDELDPRWKVLAVEGVSPLDHSFDSERYPLTVRFGFSGPVAVAAAASAEFDGPATNRDPGRLSVVVVTGVTALARATGWRMDAEGPAWPAELIGDWLSTADITHISHEVPLSDLCPPPDPSPDLMRFCGQPQHAELFQVVGADVIELTGNHIMDHSPAALLDTLDIYQAMGLKTYGGGRNLELAREPAVFEHNGHKFAFLGCNQPGPGFAYATEDGPGALPCDFEALHADISDLRAAGYLPIVTFQWAESYRNWPLPNQREAFLAAARAGAAIVSGSQAHQPQGFEFAHRALIHYGLGNLFFDQMWSTETRRELIDRHIFYNGRHISTQVYTAFLEDFAQPRPMTDEERAALLREIFSASGW